MFSAIYIEKDVADHPRVKALCERFAKLPHIIIDRYGEVFNRKAQNFRLQKKLPALILASKHDKHVLPAPRNYAIGGEHNYYFSHMMNCIYDCRYCFLQGMYRSAHYVLFINYEDFGTALEQQIAHHGEEESYYYSGYDCDSLALEPVSHFTHYFLPIFRQHPNAWLELRTKSTQIRSLLDMEPLPNCIIAYSFTPEDISKALEHKVPALQKRIDAMIKLQQRGWKIGLRFDPLIYDDRFEEQYTRLFEQVFSCLNINELHSVSMGTFRMPEQFLKNMIRLYPEEKLLASPFSKTAGLVSYPKETEDRMMQYCETRLLEYIPETIFFPCN